MPKAKTRANGTGTAYKRGRTWTCEVVVGYKPDQNGIMRPIRRTKGGFRTKTDALNAIPDIKSSGLSRKQNSIVTLDMLYTSFANSYMPKTTKKRQDIYKTSRKKIESIAYLDIRLLTIDDLQRIVNETTPTYFTARNMKTMLVQLYKRAVAEQYISVNLAEYIELPECHSKETAPFSEQEIIALWQEWQSSQDSIVGYMLLMIYTGMMPGELLILKTDMINFETQTITGVGLKTETRKETPIVLPDVILPVLHTLCNRAKNNRIAPMEKRLLRSRFYDTIKRLRLNPELRPYSCRHTTATTLAKAGTPLFAVKTIMRHADIKTTQRYVHIDTADILSSANNIGVTPDILPTSNNSITKNR